MSVQQVFSQIVGAVQARDFALAAALIKDGLGRDLALAGEGRHVLLAHWLALAADWDLVERLLPPDTNFFRVSGWLHSVACGRPLNQAGDPVPWLTYPAIDFLGQHVAPRWRVFEYGTGFSTLWWAKRTSHVHSVESNPDWHREVKTLAPQNATLELRTDPAGYVDAIKTSAHSPFDVVVIDGDARNQCAAACLPHLKENGIIVFDNTDCAEHDEGVSFLMQSGFARIDFCGPIPSYLYKNCTSVFFKDVGLLKQAGLPSRMQSSVGITCGQAIRPCR